MHGSADEDGDLMDINPPRSLSARAVERTSGCLPLADYAALGDGRTVALSGADGSIDWWCVPNMDSPPLFDRLLSPESGGYFVVAPSEAFEVTRRYRPGSNVHETVFTTASGGVRLTESLNSGSAGRLPWEELARRIEGVQGRVHLRFELRLSTSGDTVSPYLTDSDNGVVFHADRVLGVLRHGDGVRITRREDRLIAGDLTIETGEHEVLAIVAGRDEPLVIPAVDEISARIDLSDGEWRTWSDRIQYVGRHRDLVTRSALALKLLLYSPSGAIAAAATTSLPEGIGGSKNYDYRYAWVRDAGYTIKAFLRIGAQAEAKAALTWLIAQISAHGPRVMYALNGDAAPAVSELDLPGYRLSRPVRFGNDATDQRQNALYGDILDTAARFVSSGNILDAKSAELLAQLADQCADAWLRKDSGLWELEEERHYTNSKLSCWEALARAVELADGGHLPTTCRDRWARERDRILDWVDANCWSEERQAYVAYPQSDELDCAIVLAVRYGVDRGERLGKTIVALDQELGRGPFHYRYSGMYAEEGCFLACTFWIIEAKALLGRQAEAERAFEAVVTALDISSGIYPEMVDPVSVAYLGNLPQGLTHRIRL